MEIRNIVVGLTIDLVDPDLVAVAVDLAQRYNAFAGKAASLGVLDAKDSNVEGYVTEKALDGLFEMIAKQEESIRANPAAAATSLAKKVFGAL